MDRFTRMRRRLLLGVVAAALTLGGSLLEPTEALAGVGGSPGSRIQSSTLVKSCATGAHVKEVTIEL
jgi:hypothetical protein